MPNVINEMTVRELSASFEKAEGMLLVSMSGLSVRESEGIRNALAEHGIRLRMIRNRLARLAMKVRDIEPPKDMLVGNIACVWGGPEDTILAAKVLHKSDARKQGKVELRGGLLEGNLLDAGEAQALADLPSRDELRAMLLGVVSGPARGLVSVINALPAALVRVVQARIDANAQAPGSEERAEEGA